MYIVNQKKNMPLNCRQKLSCLLINLISINIWKQE